MSSRVAIRALGAGLGLLFLVGSAKAGGGFVAVPECSDPTQVPFLVYTTILGLASGGFGDLPEKTCNSITKKGISTCKSQTKLAAKCNNKALDSIYDIRAKQCAQLATSTERDDCKSAAKDSRNSDQADTKNSKDASVSECDGKFAGALSDACLNGIPK